MRINQIPYVIFQAKSQFSFKHCNIIQCHNTWFLWNFRTKTVYALDKKSLLLYSFQNFGCSNECSTNSSCHFWNPNVRVYSNFASMVSAMKDNSFVFLSSNLIYFGQIHQIPHVIFETTSQFFFRTYITLQCHGR